jgi:hypothetical protein
MYLRYTGPTHDPDDGRETLPQGSALPLPQGWPAADHNEPNEAIAAEKLASGMYEAADAPGDAGVAPAAPRRGRKQGEPVDVDPSEIPPVDTDGVPGNGGFGTATGDPFGATPPTEG